MLAETQSQMAREIAAAPDIVADQDRSLAKITSQLGLRLRQVAPRVVVTCARGSSAHAATFAKHLIERHLGIPVAAAAPGIASVYRKDLRLGGQLVLAISQSGSSDDLIAFVTRARNSNATTVAMTNDESSPLARACDVVVPLGAGNELSIPATKTFVATLSALMRVTAAWVGNAADLDGAIARLPQRLKEAMTLDWTGAVDAFTTPESLVTVGRGPTLAIAREAALKLKETCNLHAEAFSSAEFLHGPVALATPRFPLLVFAPNDAAQSGVQSLVQRLRLTGASPWVTEHGPVAVGRLPSLVPDQPEADAICLIQSFYSMLSVLAARRGLNPDMPRNLSKVTRTT
jgi:glucosamine--fructose-6-phosphate aminotransferase (isomerizing)